MTPSLPVLSPSYTPRSWQPNLQIGVFPEDRTQTPVLRAPSEMATFNLGKPQAESSRPRVGPGAARCPFLVRRWLGPPGPRGEHQQETYAQTTMLTERNQLKGNRLYGQKKVSESPVINIKESVNIF